MLCVAGGTVITAPAEARATEQTPTRRNDPRGGAYGTPGKGARPAAGDCHDTRVNHARWWRRTGQDRGGTVQHQGHTPVGAGAPATTEGELHDTRVTRPLAPAHRQRPRDNRTTPGSHTRWRRRTGNERGITARHPGHTPLRWLRVGYKPPLPPERRPPRCLIVVFVNGFQRCG
mgnify:CR=1 FL=1